MMKSMTGFGRVSFSIGRRQIAVEVKTVNHRFCEVNLRLPGRYVSLEPELAEFTKKKFHRGRIDIFVRESQHEIETRVRVNEALLEHYITALQKVSSRLKTNGVFHPELLLMLPQVVVQEEEKEDLKEALSLFQKHFSLAFAQVEKVRLKEGQGVAKDLLLHLKRIEKNLSSVQKRVPRILIDTREKLKERVHKIIQKVPDEWRLAQEIAYYADRSDISEEVQRLKSHLVHFREVMNEKEAVGRKMDFILQEMNREVNTLGAKVQDFEVSKQVVACKHGLEKMREQVQNVE